MPVTEIIHTVTGRTTAELRAARDAAVGTMVELRVDGVPDLDVAAVLQGRRVPVIVTCRAAWEGGHFDGSEEERLRILSAAAREGADYIDVEWRADRRLLTLPAGTQVVLSNHDFSGVPRDLEARVAAMRSERPAIVKVAVMASRLRDCLTLRAAMTGGGSQIAVAMGPFGYLSRLCPWLFGSRWTFGGTAAPGQIPASDMRDLYRVQHGSAATAIYAIFGAPLGHSASPAMHNQAFGELGVDAIYVPLETVDADEALAVADAVGLKGASVTAPLKSALAARVAAADAMSRQVGALNTLKRVDGQWEARNFDGEGFLLPLTRRGVPLHGRRAVVLGAGGAARTVVSVLRREGARVEIAARRVERAEALARELGATAVAWPPPPGWDLLVNTTPVGTWPGVNASPLERGDLSGGWVYDLIYNPRETTLLAWARESGARTIDGLEMLVDQARLQFEWWIDRQAPTEVMAQAASTFIEQARGHV